LLALCARHMGKKLVVHAFDINIACNLYTAEVITKFKFNRGDVIINVNEGDVFAMKINEVRALRAHCCYTSAAVNSTFSLKLFFLSLSSGTIGSLICNEDMIGHLSSASGKSRSYFQPTDFAKATVERGDHIGDINNLDDNATKRNVYIITLK